jgi:hypothetical protein
MTPIAPIAIRHRASIHVHIHRHLCITRVWEPCPRGLWPSGFAGIWRGRCSPCWSVGQSECIWFLQQHGFSWLESGCGHVSCVCRYTSHRYICGRVLDTHVNGIVTRMCARYAERVCTCPYTKHAIVCFVSLVRCARASVIRRVWHNGRPRVARICARCAEAPDWSSTRKQPRRNYIP